MAREEEAKEGEEAVAPPKPVDIHEAYIKFSQSLEKIVGATKQGLAAFKRGVDGAFFNAYDNINECFKAIEDSIVASGANTEQKKYLKIGVNTDAQGWYIEDANKYEWDGPKVQYDEDQLIDFYEKMLNEHPLVEYIEDAFTPAHIQPYKKFLAKLRESKPNVLVAAGHQLMQTNLDQIKELTQMIQPDSEEEEELPAEASRLQGAESGAEDSAAERSGTESPDKKEDEKAPEKKDDKKKGAKDDKKGGKKDAKKGAKEVVEESPKEEPVENQKPDPNFNKFCPDIIRLSRSHCPMVNQFQQILNYSFTLKAEESFAIVIEDNQIDDLNTDIVDFAFGASTISGSGGVRFLSLSGLYRPEKSCKIQRYAELVQAMANSVNKID